MRHRTLIALLLVSATLSSGCGIINRLKGMAGPTAVYAPDPKSEPPVKMPNAEGSLKFAMFGDFGTATRWQFETGDQMAKTHKEFPFELVLLAGDNLYGASRPQEYENRFEQPYKALLDAGVKFYAALGNHDDRNQRFYEPFNMAGKQYYSFKAPKQDVRFFALESTYPEPEQIQWFENELKGSGEDWKIVYMHHPLYSSGGRHGSDHALREVLEPLLLKYNVSVVLTGHDHFYERIKPQKGIVHFVVGSAGKLAPGDIDRNSPLTARGFDTDYAFLIAEILGDQMTFNAITRTGGVMDSGIIVRRQIAADSGVPVK
jgi:3',5'-cyclic AMP phosphodiesterase CpdA